MLDANLKAQLKAYLEKVTRAVSIAAYIDDSEKSKEMLALLQDDGGVFTCRTIFNCTDACPRGIEVTKAIQEVKRAILFERGDRRPYPLDAPLEVHIGPVLFRVRRRREHHICQACRFVLHRRMDDQIVKSCEGLCHRGVSQFHLIEGDVLINEIELLQRDPGEIDLAC